MLIVKYVTIAHPGSVFLCNVTAMKIITLHKFYDLLFSVSNTVHCIMYTNIDQKLRNKLHGRIHYKKVVTSVNNEHVFYTLL